MKLVMKVTPSPGDIPITVTTNLLCIAEWEKQENRKVSDGRGIGIMDMVFWAHFMLSGTSYKSKLQATPKLWLEAHPDMEIETVDMTNPNPTDAALTESN
jgi:hypothetical protein